MRCGVGETQVREHVRRSYRKKSGETVSKSVVTEHCREIFIKSKEWLTSLKDGPPVNWPFKKEKFSKWSASERKMLEERLSSLPDFVLNSYPSKIFRAQISTYPENPAASKPADRFIVIYDAFFIKNKEEQLRIISHEIGHFIFKDLAPDQIAEFHDNSGWKIEKKDGLKFVPPNKVIIEDSVDSIDEDFSNNLEIYISDEKRLKEFNHKILDYFKKYFPKKGLP